MHLITNRKKHNRNHTVKTTRFIIVRTEILTEIVYRRQRRLMTLLAIVVIIYARKHSPCLYNTSYYISKISWCS